MPDATSLLEQDHREVEALFDRYASSKDPEVAKAICMELSVHAAIEEEVLYPVLGSALPDGEELQGHAQAEHQDMKRAILRIRELGYDDPGVEGVLREMMHGVSDHFQEEEGEVFPKLRDAVGRERLDQLGEELTAAKERQQRVARGTT